MAENDKKQYADIIKSAFNDEAAAPEPPTDRELEVWKSIADDAA